MVSDWEFILFFMPNGDNENLFDPEPSWCGTISESTATA